MMLILDDNDLWQNLYLKQINLPQLAECIQHREPNNSCDMTLRPRSSVVLISRTSKFQLYPVTYWKFEFLKPYLKKVLIASI